MTEREKMLAGEPYDPGEPELVRLRLMMRQICQAYNNLPPEDEAGHDRLRMRMLGAHKERAYMEPPVWFDYGVNTSVGERFYANFGLTVLDSAQVIIGDYVEIGPNVDIYTATHPLDPTARATGLEYGKPVRIGNHVWIGGHTVINPGVTIGDNTVIGSGSVVTRDIPAGVLAAGNPCRVIRKIVESL